MCYISETGAERGLLEGSFTYSDSDLKVFCSNHVKVAPLKSLRQTFILLTDGKDDTEQTDFHKLSCCICFAAVVSVH